jgi:actin-related protein
MAASRRALKADALAAEVSFLESSAAAVQTASGDGDEEALADALAEAGFASEEALIRALGAAAARLRKLRGGADDEGEEEAPPPAPVDDAVKYPLLNVPDSELSAEDLKAKRRQRLLKGGEEARVRARAAKAAAAAAEAAEADAAAQRFAADPDAFLAELRASRAEVERRVEARKARKLGVAAPVRRGGCVPHHSACCAHVAHAHRIMLTACLLASALSLSLHREAQRERMRLMAEAAAEEAPAGGPGGKKRKKDGACGDTFGARDEDWLVYRQMERDGGSDSEAERADDASLAKLTARLAEFGGDAAQPGGGAGAGGAGGDGGDASGAGAARVDAPWWEPNSAEAHQMWLGVERIRAPEILFQPSMIGLDQAGLAEAVVVALRRAPRDARAPLAAAPLLLTGGGAALAGLQARLQAELMATSPAGRAMPGAQQLRIAAAHVCALALRFRTYPSFSDTHAPRPAPRSAAVLVGAVAGRVARRVAARRGRARVAGGHHGCAVGGGRRVGAAPQAAAALRVMREQAVRAACNKVSLHRSSSSPFGSHFTQNWTHERCVVSASRVRAASARRVRRGARARRAASRAGGRARARLRATGALRRGAGAARGFELFCAAAPQTPPCPPPSPMFSHPLPRMFTKHHQQRPPCNGASQRRRAQRSARTGGHAAEFTTAAVCACCGRIDTQTKQKQQQRRVSTLRLMRGCVCVSHGAPLAARAGFRRSAASGRAQSRAASPPPATRRAAAW